MTPCATTPERPGKILFAESTADMESALMAPYDFFPRQVRAVGERLDMADLLRGAIALARRMLGSNWGLAFSILDGGSIQSSKKLIFSGQAVGVILHTSCHWALLVWTKKDNNAVLYDGKFDSGIHDMALAVLHCLASSHLSQFRFPMFKTKTAKSDQGSLDFSRFL